MRHRRLGPDIAKGGSSRFKGAILSKSNARRPKMAGRA